MKQKIKNFMYGRYGMDLLNVCLLVLCLIFMLLSTFFSPFSSLALVCICYALFRYFSRNIYARRAENNKVLPYISFVKAKFQNRKTHKVFLCPICKRTLRVPKGKGNITLSCPCGNSIKGKS
ncbi:MAG: hypothetical protein ACI3XA_07105 [Clostridia bacterium]